jgi:succinate-acetate transporter protein
VVNDGLPARVFLRPIGTPLTIGMSGLAIASLVESGLQLHWVAKSQAHDVGLILIAVAFVLQLIACVLSYLSRDGAVGAVLGVLAASWLGMGLVHLTPTPGSRSGALGLLMLSAGGVLVLSALVAGSTKPLPAAVFLLAAVRFALTGIFQLGDASAWQNAAGIVGLVVAVGAAYCLLAFELEGQHRRPILPTMRRGAAAAALSGGPETQLEGVENEAGVRLTG